MRYGKHKRNNGHEKLVMESDGPMVTFSIFDGHYYEVYMFSMAIIFYGQSLMAMKCRKHAELRTMEHNKNK